MSKLDIAQQDLKAGHLDAACGSLGAFVIGVNVQSGKRFGAVQAAELIAEATAIGQSIGCQRGVP